MSVVSETTNARGAWFCIMSLAIYTVVQVLRIWHLNFEVIFQ